LRSITATIRTIDRDLAASLLRDTDKFLDGLADYFRKLFE